MALIFPEFCSRSPDLAKGTGIGLAICRSIVDRHEGEFNFLETEEQGACFYFTLPLSMNKSYE
ncbi:HAMP domain-containing histidine kinase [Legionella sp. km772]|nr:HAMP domain-containing histidine kinase [Legionella sp. km772]